MMATYRRRESKFGFCGALTRRMMVFRSVGDPLDSATGCFVSRPRFGAPRSAAPPQWPRIASSSQGSARLGGIFASRTSPERGWCATHSRRGAM